MYIFIRTHNSSLDLLNITPYAPALCCIQDTRFLPIIHLTIFNARYTHTHIIFIMYILYVKSIGGASCNIV